MSSKKYRQINKIMLDKYRWPMYNNRAINNPTQKTEDKHMNEDALFDLLNQLSTRTVTCLLRSKIRSVSDLQTMSDYDLLCIRNLGKRGLNEIRQYIPAPSQITFADRFSELYERSGLSQAEMASSLGLSQAMVSKILNHKASPSKTVMILAELLYGTK